MNPNQPPGWGPPSGSPGQGGAFGQQGAFGQPSQGAFGNAPPQPQGAFGGAPAQPAFPQQPQGAFGPPSQAAFGAPPQAAFGASPQLGQASQPATAFGAPSQGAFGASPSIGGGTFGVAPGAITGPPRKLGLFEAMPCPHCGQGMRSSAGYGAMAGRMVGGLVGWLLVSALASSYSCPSHGEVSKDALPEEHRKVVTMRKLMMVGGAGALFVLAVGLMCVVSALNELR